MLRCSIKESPIQNTRSEGQLLNPEEKNKYMSQNPKFVTPNTYIPEYTKNPQNPSKKSQSKDTFVISGESEGQ